MGEVTTPLVPLSRAPSTQKKQTPFFLFYKCMYQPGFEFSKNIKDEPLQHWYLTSFERPLNCLLNV